jgi:hypothetical protein
MTDETFVRHAQEEDSQSVAAGTIPVECCPTCESLDIGSIQTENHRRCYCRNCTTTWSPALVAEAVSKRKERN